MSRGAERYRSYEGSTAGGAGRAGSTPAASATKRTSGMALRCQVHRSGARLRRPPRRLATVLDSILAPATRSMMHRSSVRQPSDHPTSGRVLGARCNDPGCRPLDQLPRRSRQNGSGRGAAGGLRTERASHSRDCRARRTCPETPGRRRLLPAVPREVCLHLLPVPALTLAAQHVATPTGISATVTGLAGARSGTPDHRVC